MVCSCLMLLTCVTCGCSAASNWKSGAHVVSTIVCLHRVQAVTKSRPAREIDDVLQITIKFTLEASNRTRGNTSYILGHCIEKANCSPSKAIIGK